MHDAKGERQISLEGFAFWPLLSADGQKLCFRITRGFGTGQSPSELWVTDLKSGLSQRLFPGQLVTSYDLSPTDRVVAAVAEPDGHSRAWVASLDGRDAPRRIPQGEGDNPRFEPDGAIILRVTEGTASRVYRMGEDGQGRERIAVASGAAYGRVSPDGEWLSDGGSVGTSLLSMRGREAVPLYPFAQTARARWSPDGKYVYISVQYGQASALATAARMSCRSSPAARCRGYRREDSTANPRSRRYRAR
jgi:dipeptidyl aminopeptidase/acylaminoacyl peptidase